MGLISSYNIRSMTVRKGTAAMTAMGIAMVVAVFVMTMAIAQGFNGALVASVGDGERGAAHPAPIDPGIASGRSRQRRTSDGVAGAGRHHRPAARVR